MYYAHEKIGENFKKVEEKHKKIWISSSFFCAFALKYILSCFVFPKFLQQNCESCIGIIAHMEALPKNMQQFGAVSENQNMENCQKNTAQEKEEKRSGAHDFESDTSKHH